MHTALDTSGYVKIDVLKDILKHVDLVLYDIKHLDPEKHKEYIGVSNELILSNLFEIDELGIPIEIRMPTIPGINDTEENLLALCQLVDKVKSVERIRLLPYHRLGEGKYERLELEYRLKGLETPKKERMEELVQFIKSNLNRDIPVSSG
jgi:pyruvate formate lyase activating enzyme